MNGFLGLKVVSSPYAITVKVTHEVRRNPIKKRRRQWRVVRVETTKPACWQLADGTLVMHPELFAAISATTPDGQASTRRGVRCDLWSEE